MGGKPMRGNLGRQLAGGRRVVTDEAEARDGRWLNEPIEVKAVLALDLATDGILQKRHRLREAGGKDDHVGVDHVPVGELDRVSAAEALNDRLLDRDAPAPDERVGLRPEPEA